MGKIRVNDPIRPRELTTIQGERISAAKLAVILTRLRLRPTRRVGTVARRRSLVKAFSGRGGHRFSAQAQTENTCGYCGSDRRFMTSVGRTKLK